MNVRSEMMFESIEIISKLFEGGVVKHRGQALQAREREALHPAGQPVPIYVATSGPINAKKTGRFAQGMITVGAADEKIKLLWMACDEGCAEAGKPAVPKLLQLHVSWAPTEEEALDNAMRRVAERRHGLPEAGHQEPRGLRRDGEARPARGLQEPRPDQRGPRASTSPTSSATSTWASTRSTSTTSGATRPSSSRSSAARSCRT